MLKIEDLKAGDELECINRDGYLSQEIGIPRIRRHILSKPIIVLEVTKSGVRMVGRSMQIPLDSLKYFKKKEQSQYTFNDLIDVAVQAYKDGILSGLSLDNVGTRKVSCWSEGFSDHAFDQLNGYKRIIDSINALYKETFTIDQSNENLQRVKVGATIKNHPSGSPFVLENQDAIDDLHDAPYWLTNGLIVEQSRND